MKADRDVRVNNSRGGGGRRPVCLGFEGVVKVWRWKLVDVAAS